MNLCLLRKAKAEGLEVVPYELLKFEDINVQDIINEKRALIEAHGNLLLSRSEVEIRLLQKITKEILSLLDTQKKTILSKVDNK